MWLKRALMYLTVLVWYASTYLELFVATSNLVVVPEGAGQIIFLWLRGTEIVTLHKLHFDRAYLSLEFFYLFTVYSYAIYSLFIPMLSSFSTYYVHTAWVRYKLCKKLYVFWNRKRYVLWIIWFDMNGAVMYLSSRNRASSPEIAESWSCQLK